MKRNDNGFVLIIVLWLVAILTVIALGFGHRALLDRRAAVNSVDQLQAQAMARGAVRRGVAAVRNKLAADQSRAPSEGPNIDRSWKNIPDLLADSNGYTLGGAVEIEGELCRVIIEEAEGKISINTASEELLDAIGLDDGDVNLEIMERRDTSPEESATPFLAIEELRALDLVSEDDWNGDAESPGIKDLITVWGDGKIDINAAPRAVLEKIPDISENTIEAIMTTRPVSNLDVLANSAGLLSTDLENLRTYCKVQSSFFIIRGFATQRKAKVVAQCAAVVQATPEGPVIIDWQELPIAQ